MSAMERNTPPENAFATLSTFLFLRKAFTLIGIIARRIDSSKIKTMKHSLMIVATFIFNLIIT